jgi:hypothetical protein
MMAASGLFQKYQTVEFAAKAPTGLEFSLNRIVKIYGL